MDRFRAPLIKKHKWHGNCSIVSVGGKTLICEVNRFVIIKEEDVVRLKDKVAIITGAGRGIGAVTAKRFSEEGAKVVIASLFEHEVEETVNEIKAMGNEALGIAVDVTNAIDVEAMIAKTVETYGKVDIIVNNAGITADNTLVRMTEDEFDRVINVNLKGVYNCGQAAAKVMVEQGGGVFLMLRLLLVYMVIMVRRIMRLLSGALLV